MLGGVKYALNYENILTINFTRYEVYDAIVPFAWQLLRLTSFSLSRCTDSQKLSAKTTDNEKRLAEWAQRYSLINYLGYGFYLPMFMQGPMLIYRRYVDMIQKNESAKNCNDLQSRLQQLMIMIFRLTAIHLVNELLMHYLYLDAFLYDTDVSLPRLIWEISFFVS